MKTKWVKETPQEEGWFWIRYKGKNGTVTCPCTIYHFHDGSCLVQTARNDTFTEGPNHGGPGLKYAGKLDRSIRFGSKIEEPE